MHGLHSFRSCRLHVLAETAFSARCVEALLPLLHEASVTLYLFRLESVCLILFSCFSWNPPGLVRCPDFGVGIWIVFCTTRTFDQFGAFCLFYLAVDISASNYR